MPRTVLFVLLAFFSTGVSADTVWKGTSTFSNATGSGDVLDPVGATVYLSGDSTGSERFIGTTTSLDAAPLRRREVRLSGLLRVKEGAGNAALWVRADGPDGPLAFVNSAGAPVRVGTGVHSRELRLYIPSGTTSLKLGVTLESAGRVEVEDLRLTSESTTSGGASAYDMLEYALATIPGNALNAGNVDWPKERATRLTPDLKELPAAEGYKQIRAILDALADRHSFLQQPREASEYLSTAVPTKAIEARQLPDIGYVLVPGLRGTNAAAGEAFAMQLCEQVKRLAPSSSKGWILDLRQNTGGNMWPMMSGLYPLLGSSGIGAFRDRDGARRPWRLRARKGCDFNLTNSRVAVLVGPRTGSSGEAVAIAFRARAETKFFGRTTAGRATSNRSYPLPDGGALRLTTSTLLDRSGEEYPQGITPEVLLANGQDAVEAAAEWLRSKP